MQEQEAGAATGSPAAPTLSGDTAATAAPHGGDAATAPKDPRRLLAPARILVLLSLALAVVGIGSEAMNLQFFHKLETGAFANDAEMMDAAEASDQRQLIILVPYIIVLILAYIFVGRWIYFSNKNLRALGAVGLSFKPGWAVGWYFVPIANLWKPYQAMKEIWQASSDPLDWPRQRTPGLMPVWWAFWVIGSIADRISYRLTSTAETFAEIKLAGTVAIAGGGIYVVVCAVFVMLMTRISRLQIDAMENKSTLAVFGP